MKTPLLSTLLVASATMATSATAATITYTGFQANVDAKQTELPTVVDSVGWRNPTPVKSRDVDGDNIIGTDGYAGRAGNSLPGYVTGFNSIGGGNPFGYVDDPTDPTGIDDARAGFRGSTAASADMFWFQITGTAVDGQTLGVAIMYDAFGTGTQTYTLEQRDGGKNGSVITSASSGALANDNNGYDWAWFEIDGAAAGDWFVLKSVRGTSSRVTYSQVAFDTAPVPEPGSLALLALGGLMIGARRRG